MNYKIEYEQLIQNLPAAVYTCNAKGIITFYNEAAAQLWGHTPALGKEQSANLWKIYDSKGELLTPEKHPLATVLKEQKKINSQEIMAERHDGVKLYLLSSPQPLFNSSGVFTGCLDMLVDITNQKQEQQDFRESIIKKNEELLRQKEFVETMIDSSVDIISVYDKDTNFIALNKKCEELYSIKSEQIIGKKYQEVFPEGAESSDSFDYLTRALKGEYIHNVIHKSDTLGRSFEVFIVPLKHSNEIYAVLSVIHDITALMKVSEKLQLTNHVLEEKNKELERSNKELASFSYIASHDLQEPLRKIITFADKLLEAPEITMTESTKTYLNKIINSSERMRQLIEDVLNFSSISSEEKFTETDLNIIATNVATDFEQQIFEKNATLRIDTLPTIPAIPLQMRQLFHNLISNALKFTNPSTPPLIEIYCKEVSSEEITKKAGLNKSFSYVKIIFKDNGIGFNQEFAEQIFIIFQRLHGNNMYTGTGIGLALCRKITDNHNGVISAESIEGRGTEFEIILPSKISFLN